MVKTDLPGNPVVPEPLPLSAQDPITFPGAHESVHPNHNPYDQPYPLDSLGTQNGAIHSHFLDHLASYPLFHDVTSALQSHPLTARAAKTIKGSVAYVATYTGPISPYLAKADAIADGTLGMVEERFPVLKATKEEVGQKVEDGVGVVKSTVGVYAQAAEPFVKERVEPTVGPYLKPALDKVEGALNTYLPGPGEGENRSDAGFTMSYAEAAERANHPDWQSASSINEDRDSQPQVPRAYNLALMTASRVLPVVWNTTSWALTHPLAIPGALLNTASDVTTKATTAAYDIADKAKDELNRVYEAELEARGDKPGSRLSSRVRAGYGTIFTLRDEASSAIKDVVKPRVEVVKRTVGDVVVGVDKTAAKAVDLGVDITVHSIHRLESVAGRVERNLESGAEYVRGRGEEVIDTTKRAAGVVYDAAGNVIEQAEDVAAPYVDAAAEQAAVARDRAFETGEEVLGYAVGTAEEVGRGVRSAAEGVEPYVREGIETAKTGAKYAQATVEVGAEQVKVGVDAARTKASEVTSDISAKASEVKDEVEAKAGEVKGRVEAKAGEAKAKVEEKAGDVKKRKEEIDREEKIGGRFGPGKGVGEEHEVKGGEGTRVLRVV
ncbi:hypothetical protein SAICODRAFT_5947 [Saitoella complicata NRRL Y-17804]|uniref:Uncharacterized protein n=1 Tax=Saitoella complicata (strain BCRC 22490 / CBS 7301 / JCM 7358 / NBRC 10748 / NRRL Y-17804) TaxID=698492 RepID=A0A0E9NRD1_SAICN|nr:uncharacterized protein SAICODRAFT_5947 [Saitoella complicata NRRL Y-17804]ODQ54752.1 hypothetical protein SAICODRAFT_5947 [Saitoella complicata NRRL Y-17804]GAO51975.1 hypothetical protein G7K_6063-t1 [Saitoella complicata NRRL Y-17804]